MILYPVSDLLKIINVKIYTVHLKNILEIDYSFSPYDFEIAFAHSVIFYSTFFFGKSQFLNLQNSVLSTTNL